MQKNGKLGNMEFMENMPTRHVFVFIYLKIIKRQVTKLSQRH